MNRIARSALRISVGAVLVYLVSCAVVAVAYRPFLYPVPSRADPPLASDATKIEAHTGDGATARALRFGPAPADAPLTIVFFHGNGELAEDGETVGRELASHGYSVELAEYRGYGLSRGAGAPTERGLYEDAEAIVEATGVPNDRLVLMGFSLGTGIAVEMAARGHGRAVILLAPYTSIPAVATRWVQIFPMTLLMRDRFDSLSKAPRIDLPVFVAHGDRDHVVPFDMGETLAHTFPHGRFVTVPGAGHMTLFQADDHLMQKIVDFLIDVTPL
ncbi:MAG TPA: alpha/beta fold hydrolase [Polyangiaceae bacterium]|jgi:hypothetical protein